MDRKQRSTLLLVLVVGALFFLGTNQLVASPIERQSSTTHKTFENISILVPSCDKYEPLWHPFFSLMFQYWPSLKTTQQALPIYLISNQKAYPDPRVQSIQIQNEVSWSDNLIHALKQVKTDYVLVILEDFFFTSPVKEDRLYELFEGFKQAGAAQMQVTNHDIRYNEGQPHFIPGVQIKPKHGLYRVSFKIGLWDKADLLFLLKPGESAWKIETAGSLRSQGVRKPFLTVKSNQPITHLNAAYEGVISQSAIDFVHSQGIAFDPKNFPRNTDLKQKTRYLLKDTIRYSYKKVIQPLYLCTKQLIFSLGSDWG